MRLKFWLLACCALAACSGVGSSVREYTYPPEFTYISAEQLHSSMWRLANQIRWLDAMLRDDATPEPERGRRIRDVLDKIQAESRELASERAITNHPLLDKHLPRLREDVAMARTAASANPPSYVLAGAVAGACIYCHEHQGPAPHPNDDPS
jgi:hypothetical protein